MDTALIEKRLAHIGACVGQLRRLARPDRLADDPIQMGFVVYSLQTAVQAALDVAALIVADRGLGEPASNREMFEKLAIDGWVPRKQVTTWRQIVGFRNDSSLSHRALGPADHRGTRRLLARRQPDRQGPEVDRPRHRPARAEHRRFELPLIDGVRYVFSSVWTSGDEHYPDLSDWRCGVDAAPGRVEVPGGAQRPWSSAASCPVGIDRPAQCAVRVDSTAWSKTTSPPTGP